MINIALKRESSSVCNLCNTDYSYYSHSDYCQGIPAIYMPSIYIHKFNIYHNYYQTIKIITLALMEECHETPKLSRVKTHPLSWVAG